MVVIKFRSWDVNFNRNDNRNNKSMVKAVKELYDTKCA